MKRNSFDVDGFLAAEREFKELGNLILQSSKIASLFITCLCRRRNSFIYTFFFIHLPRNSGIPTN